MKKGVMGVIVLTALLLFTSQLAWGSETLSDMDLSDEILASVAVNPRTYQVNLVSSDSQIDGHAFQNATGITWTNLISGDNNIVNQYLNLNFAVFIIDAESVSISDLFDITH